MYRLSLLLFSYFLLSSSLMAAPIAYQINPVAGNGELGYNSTLEALETPFNLPVALAEDAAGNLYIADQYNHRIRKINHAGEISDVAGTGTAGYSGDNAPALEAELNLPSALVFDADGSLYIADSGNHVVRKIDSEGVISTVVGNGTAGSEGNNTAGVDAQLNNPQGLAFDSAGRLYISDTNNHQIRWLDTDGTLYLLAGNKEGFAGDNDQLEKVRLSYSKGLAFNAQGRLFIADSGNHRIRFLNAQSQLETVAGEGTPGFSGDGGAATKAHLRKPHRISFDKNGVLYIADSDNHRIRQVENGMISTIAGSGPTEVANGAYGLLQGEGSLAALNTPYGLLASEDKIYIADSRNQRIRALTPSTETSRGIKTIAGSGKTGLRQGGFAGERVAALQARLNVPSAVAVDSQGKTYIADTANHRIRQIDSQGVITTVAGIGTSGYSGDGKAATKAQLQRPAGLAIDAQDRLYISDSGNHVVRRLDKGMIETIAGSGVSGKDQETMPAPLARFHRPLGLAFAADGSLYIADAANHQIKRLVAEQVEIVAGSGYKGFAGDGGKALAAKFNKPNDVAFDSEGNLYISDQGNNRIRRLDSEGMINTVLGTGKKRYSQNGMVASETPLAAPAGLKIAADYLYFSEFYSDRVRVLRLGAETLSTFAGAGVMGFNGDNNSASSSQLYAPTGLAINPHSQTLLVADTYNHRVRSVPLLAKVSKATEPETDVSAEIAPVTEPEESEPAVEPETKPEEIEKPESEEKADTPSSEPITVDSNTAAAINTETDETTKPTNSTTEEKASNTSEQASTNDTVDSKDEPNTVSVEKPSDSKPTAVVTPPVSLPAVLVKNPADTPYMQQDFACQSLTHPQVIALDKSYQGTALLDEINQLDLFKQQGWQMQQVPKTGYLRLNQDNLRLALWPLQLHQQKNPAGLDVSANQVTRFYFKKDLVLTAQPAAQALCELQGHFAAQGYPLLRMNAAGNIQIGNSERPIALSMRPDWISTEVAEGVFPGILLSNALFPAQQLAIAQVFVDEKSRLRRQFFYPMPAFDLSPYVQQLQTPPFEPLQFSYQGKDYQGWLDVHVQNAPRSNRLEVKSVEDFNGDGQADWRIDYPQGFSQLLFAE